MTEKLAAAEQRLADFRASLQNPALGETSAVDAPTDDARSTPLPSGSASQTPQQEAPGTTDLPASQGQDTPSQRSLLSRVTGGRLGEDNTRAANTPPADTDGGGLAGAATGLAVGAARGPAIALGSAFDTANDVGMFVGNFTKSQLRKAGLDDEAAGAANAVLDFAPIRYVDSIVSSFDDDDDGDTDIADRLSGVDFGLNRVGNDLANDFGSQASAFLTGYNAIRSVAVARGPQFLSSGLQGGGAARVASEAAVGAVADVAFITAQEKNLAATMEQAGVLPEFLEFMATDEDDSALEQRLKGALEGAVLGVGVDTALTASARAYKALRAGKVAQADTAMREASEAIGVDPETAGQKKVKAEVVTEASEKTIASSTKDKLDRSFARQRSAEARLSGNEATVARAQDAARNAEVTTETLVKDANEALAKVGVDERLNIDTLKVSSDGRFVVTAPTKRALSEHGFGDAFVTAKEAVTERGSVIFKGTDSSGAARIGGAMTRQDFAEFSARVKALATGGAENANVKGSTGQFTFAHAGSTVDAAIMMRAAVDSLGSDVKTVTKDADLAKTVAEMRNTVGTDPSTALAFAQAIAPNPNDAAQALLATRVLFEDAAEALKPALDIDWNGADDLVVEEALDKIHHYTSLASLYAQHSSSAGRTLRATQIPNRDIYKAGFGLDNVPAGADKFPLPRNRKELSEWTKIWKALDDDPEGRLRWISNKTLNLPSGTRRLRNSIVNFWTASILSAPKTTTLNFVGPALVGGIRTFEKSGGALIRATIPSKLSAAERLELIAEASDAARAYGSLALQNTAFLSKALANAASGKPIMAGLDNNLAAQAAVESGRAFAENSVRTGAKNSAFDFDNRFKRVDADILDAAQVNSKFARGQHALANYINVFPRVFSRLNAGLDDFTSRLSAMGEAQFDGYRLAREQGIPPSEHRAFVLDHVQKQFNEDGAIVDEALRRRALRTTLTDQVGGTRPDGQDTITRKAANALNTIRQDFPETRFILPVFSIPANGLGEGLRRIPVAGSLFSESIRELKGEMGQAAQNEAYGRMLSGAAFMLFGAQMARSGNLTGTGPEDPADRAAWRLKYQPTSLRVGDQWVDWSRYDILNVAMAVPAALYDDTVYRASDTTTAQKVSFGMAAIAELMRDRAALQTLSDFMNIGGSGSGQTEAAIQRFNNNLVSGFVPNFVTTVFTDPSDPVLRTASNPYEAVLKKLPFTSQTLEPIYNTFGEPVYKPRDTLLEGTLPIVLTDDVSWEDDPVSDEIHRIFQVTGYGSGTRRPDHIDGGKFKAEQVRLEDGSSMYSSYMRLRRDTKVGGKTLRQALDTMFKSKAYARAADAGPSVKENSFGQVSRGRMISDVFREYNKTYKVQLAKDSPTALRYLALAKAKEKDSDKLIEYSVQTLVDNPDILTSMGLDVTKYERQILKGK